MGVRTDGTLWGWGWGNNYQHGHFDPADRSSPVQVGSVTSWNQVSGGYYHSFARRTDGSVWAWGGDVAGSLGLIYSVGFIHFMEQMGAVNNWSQVVAGGLYSNYALRTNGTLWAWGSNSSGQLGDGNVIPRSSPTQVGSLNGWAQVVGGQAFTLGLRTDGTLWAWGSNAHGQLGIVFNGRATALSSPTQVGSLNNWAQVGANGYGSGGIRST